MNWQKIGFVVVSVLVVALLAQLSFKITPSENFSIPITGQTLGVITVALLCKRETGILIMACYLLIGALGIPVFANASSGWTHLTGNSAGYLWAFLLVPLLVGKSENHDHASSYKSAVVAQLIGTAFILFCGSMYLTLQVGLSTALKYGLYPFVIGGIIKSAIGAFIAWKIKALTPFRSL